MQRPHVLPFFLNMMQDIGLFLKVQIADNLILWERKPGLAQVPCMQSRRTDDVSRVYLCDGAFSEISTQLSLCEGGNV